MITMSMWRTIFIFGTLVPLVPLASSQAVLSGNAEISGRATLAGGIQYSTTWSEYARRATLAVGVVQNDGTGDRFVTGAAAVMIRDQRNRVLVATALHVFSEPSTRWAPEALHFRGWRDEQRSPFEDLGTKLVLRQNGTPLYVASKNFDLVVVPAPPDLITRLLDPASGKLYALAPEDIAGVDDTYDGADIFILGFPALVGASYQQRALMRTGIIAWTDSSGPTSHEFLVDSRIFPGNSGGPVFSSAAGMTRNASITSSRRIKLLGLVSKTINAKPELALGMPMPNVMIIGAAGAGIIEPAQELLSLMAQLQ